MSYRNSGIMIEPKDDIVVEQLNNKKRFQPFNVGPASSIWFLLFIQKIEI